MDRLIRPLVFDCEGDSLAGVLHGSGERGFLIVSGGLQTRAGPHRLFVELAEAMAARGFAALRFDRRGVGDSDGDDAGFEGSSADIACAAAALGGQSTVGFGLCDGAAALALLGADAGLTDLILLNPWSIDGLQAPELSPTARRQRLVQRLFSPAAWRRLLAGGVNVRHSIGDVLARPSAPSTSALANRIVESVNAFPGRILLVLSSNDATAQHFAALLPRLNSVAIARLPGADHTLTREQDFSAMLAAMDSFLR